MYEYTYFFWFDHCNESFAHPKITFLKAASRRTQALKSGRCIWTTGLSQYIHWSQWKLLSKTQLRSEIFQQLGINIPKIQIYLAQLQQESHTIQRFPNASLFWKPLISLPSSNPFWDKRSLFSLLIILFYIKILI